MSAIPYMDEFFALILSILSGVIVSLVTLSLAGWQRARQESRAEARRREATANGEPLRVPVAERPRKTVYPCACGSVRSAS